MPLPRQEWTDKASRHLKAELKRAGVTYEGLAQRLSEMGIPESKASVTVKVNRGTFTAGFFLSALKAIGANVVRIEDV